MNDIDTIMAMLDWKNPEEVQMEGRRLAKHVRSINVFIQPVNSECGKNVWENCALILKERPDDELKPHLHKMFEWIYDLNWPGALHIFDRLLCYGDKDYLEFILSVCINEAKALTNTTWLNVLTDFKKMYISLNTNN